MHEADLAGGATCRRSLPPHYGYLVSLNPGEQPGVHEVDLEKREQAADPAFRFVERVLELLVHERRGPSLAFEHAREDGLHTKQPDVYEYVGIKSRQHLQRSFGRPQADATSQEAQAEPVMSSWYGPGFAGNLTANGEVFDPQAYTAAHPYLPFGTMLEVCYVDCVTVRVNDRGPYVHGRGLDLSQGAAQVIGLSGVDYVDVRVL